MVQAIRYHRQTMKTTIINGSEVSRLPVAIQAVTRRLLSLSSPQTGLSSPILNPPRTKHCHHIRSGNVNHAGILFLNDSGFWVRVGRNVFINNKYSSQNDRDKFGFETEINAIIFMDNALYIGFNRTINNQTRHSRAYYLLLPLSLTIKVAIGSSKKATHDTANNMEYSVLC